jgi:chemotaxis signal transduction protein
LGACAEWRPSQELLPGTVYWVLGLAYWRSDVIALLGLYNVLEKLCANEALSAKQ